MADFVKCLNELISTDFGHFWFPQKETFNLHEMKLLFSIKGNLISKARKILFPKKETFYFQKKETFYFQEGKLLISNRDT